MKDKQSLRWLCDTEIKNFDYRILQKLKELGEDDMKTFNLINKCHVKIHRKIIDKYLYDDEIFLD